MDISNNPPQTQIKTNESGYKVVFLEPVKSILVKKAQKENIGFCIKNKECCLFLERLLKKDCKENSAIFAKILLECENEILTSSYEKHVISNTLHHFRTLLVVYPWDFDLNPEEVLNLSNKFNENMTLINPFYRASF